MQRPAGQLLQLKYINIPLVFLLIERTNLLGNLKDGWSADQLLSYLLDVTH